jgi:hypothetical protein
MKTIKRVNTKNVSLAVAIGRRLLAAKCCVPVEMIDPCTQSELAAYLATRGSRLVCSESRSVFSAGSL